ncbi:hypothetical protein MKX01_042583 [Papaver californicum]|nr:hypothetical protein MKX01_042583 [Papaver californicum]
MSFYWGNSATTVLFHHWPGDSYGMYILSLILVFVLSFLVEWLGHFLGRPQICEAFSDGIFIVAVLGHGLGGYFVFGSQVFIKTETRLSMIWVVHQLGFIS